MYMLTPSNWMYEGAEQLSDVKLYFKPVQHRMQVVPSS